MFPNRLGKERLENYNQVQQFGRQRLHRKSSFSEEISGYLCGLPFLFQRPKLDKVELEYGHILRDELDTFTKGRIRHKISFVNVPNQEMIICEVEATKARQQLEVSLADTNGHMKASLNQLKQKLSQQFSQWIYVQRSLRIFDGSKVYICKAPRLIDWTKTQALHDADDLIAEVLSGNFGERGTAMNGKR